MREPYIIKIVKELSTFLGQEFKEFEQSINERLRDKKPVLINGRAPAYKENNYIVDNLEKDTNEKYLSPLSISIEGDIEYNRDIVKGKIREEGIEAIAWYAPIHHYGRYYWGIYYDLNAIVYFCEELFGRPVDTNLLNEGIKIIRNHELFHFKIEMLWTSIEIACNNPKYYTSYYNVNNPYEEALATAIQYKKAYKYRKRLKDILDNLPYGYNEYKDYLSNSKFREAISEILSSVSYIPESIKNHLDLGTIFFNDKPFIIPETRVPEWLLIDQNNTWIKTDKRFPSYCGCKVQVYSNEHEPPHIHIFIPANKEKGSYIYPDLTPYRNSTPLSNNDLNRLRRYFEKHSNIIIEKIRKVYPNFPNAHIIPPILGG
jgi:hypothetical protein